MIRIVAALVFLCAAHPCWGGTPENRVEAEYYVAQYARHYGVPVDLVRSIVQQESGWHPCVVSSKGAVGLMQLMPATAKRLGVRNRCNVNENISGGVRYLASLMRTFHGDLRLVAAAYYAGEGAIGKGGLGYRNPNVVAYVSQVRTLCELWAKGQSKVSDKNRRTRKQ
ncbi:MAG TPA: lytic transglycosylase domain-containing protein [Candidatus Saccharimonadales bacterium]|jgi:soluble lytic murein transglycosylase|nr:lytic transglycosylase domain-containing protein [Candidatus Saccharimonadales bacterium]